MTLEQIKNRQQEINEMLYALLSDTSVVVERIVGEQPKQDTDGIAGYTASGLLEEINQSQNFTETYIQTISAYINLLSRGTFAPEEIVTKSR